MKEKNSLPTDEYIKRTCIVVKSLTCTHKILKSVKITIPVEPLMLEADISEYFNQINHELLTW